jgi:Na+/proline symporter
VAGLLVATSLVAALLLVHFSIRKQPMPEERPLDVDIGLPLPEVGQASTIFSLTALFGAYLGIHLLLGLPALLGLATGTVLALLLIRSWIAKTGADSFDSFLYGFLGTNQGNSTVLAFGLSAIQCAFAASELLILKDVVDLCLGMRSDHATLLVVALGVIAYFYVLFGGYMAVFRTDVLQFLLVTGMALLTFSLALLQGSVSLSGSGLLPRPGYWDLPLNSPRPVLYLYHFILGLVMGLGFLLASPDAWKRVFLVSSANRQHEKRFTIFAAVGAAPFLVLIPIAAWSRRIPDGAISIDQMWSGVLASSTLFVATALGLVASFLSAFNGAVLSSVHVGLVARRRISKVPSELSRFNWLMVATLVTIFFLFAAMRSLGNPYLLANVLMGPYASVAGVLVAANGRLTRIPDGSMLWIITIGLAAWFIYVAGTLGMPTTPTTYQVNTVPGGVLLFAASAGVCKANIAMGGRRV